MMVLRMRGDSGWTRTSGLHRVKMALYRLSYGITREHKENGLSVFNSNKSLIEVTGQSSHAPSADGRGFEPLNLMRSLAFETSAIDRSANRP